MSKKLTRRTLKTILENADLESLTLEELKNLFIKDKEIAQYAPDGFYQIDPRNGDRIIYNSARAKRPHDNRPHITRPMNQEDKPCVICSGKTTGVIDVADLSDGFTFINKNLFPIFYPESTLDPENVKNGNFPSTHGMSTSGYHFLQWTSSDHEKDWHNMPLADRKIVMGRLAALEKKMAADQDQYVSIIKNYGHLVGGSLVHGHQQIGVSNVMPNRVRQNMLFGKEHDALFSSFLLRENPSDLNIKDYGAAVLATPYFMRRPYDMVLILKDPKKSYLYEMDERELTAVCDGWQDAIRIMRIIMPMIGREMAYNVITHNGGGAGLYFEFLPYTQEMGGFEHLGLFLCQGNPKTAAHMSRKILSDMSKQGKANQ